MLALSETGRGDDMALMLQPPAEGAAAALPVLKGGSEAPPLRVPAQTLTAMPLTPAAEGTPAPGWRPMSTGRDGN
jgi:hypothetical protein